MLRIKEFLIYKILREVYFWMIKYFLSPLRDLIYKLRIVIDEHFWEKRLNIRTEGCDQKNNDVTKFKDRLGYQPTPYHNIKVMLDHMQFESEDVFVELGCGKGRVVLAMAKKKFRKVIGIEFCKSIFNVALQNLEHCKEINSPVEFINADVSEYDMSEGTIFFMFNPFGRQTHMQVLRNIKNSLIVKPRKIRIIYIFGPSIHAINGYDQWLEHERKFSCGWPSHAINIWKNK